MPHMAAGEYDALLNGVRIHYSIGGNGPVILAHSGGPGMDARGWDDLAGLGKYATLVVLHPRGSGLSGPAPEDAYLLPDYASDVEALRRHLGLEKFILMGWSHGGMVAQQYAFSYPEALSKLILFDTSAYFGEFLGDIEAAVREFRDQPWFERSFAALKAEWDGQYETDEEMGRLWAEEMKFYFKHFDPRAEAYYRRTRDYHVAVRPLKVFNEKEAPSLDLRARLREIRVPTLVIVGRHDFITNTVMAEEMVKHLPQARLEIFEDSGHFALVEEPEKFRDVIRDFIQEA